jgi:hypothetical protein
MLYQKAFEQYNKLGKRAARCLKHILHLTRAIQEEIVEFLTDKMEDPYFLNVLSVASRCNALQTYPSFYRHSKHLISFTQIQTAAGESLHEDMLTREIRSV